MVLRRSMDTEPDFVQLIVHQWAQSAKADFARM
jgi:hypothetical protein